MIQKLFTYGATFERRIHRREVGQRCFALIPIRTIGVVSSSRYILLVIRQGDSNLSP